MRTSRGVGVTIFLLLGVSCFASVVTSGRADEGEKGSGGGILDQMRYYLGQMTNIAAEVGSGVERLSRHIRTAEEFLDATVDEDCYFQCPPETVMKERKGHVASSNGCGSYGIEDYLNGDYLPMDEFVSCCNAHDLCYETCGTDRDECDLRFKKCLYSECRSARDSVTHLKYKGCQVGAKLLYTGTTAMGCKAFLEAQNNACECVHKKAATGDKRNTEF